jgi:hypothetical protein
VLVLHGFKGFMDWGFFPELARAIARAGFAAVRFNFSGSGVGEDRERFTEPRAFFENTPSRELDDVERVRAWLDAGAVPDRREARSRSLGHSLGGRSHRARRAARRLSRARRVVERGDLPPLPARGRGVWRRQGFVEIPNLRTQEIHRLGSAGSRTSSATAPRSTSSKRVPTLPTPTLALHGPGRGVPLARGVRCEASAPARGRLEIVPAATTRSGGRIP